MKSFLTLSAVLLSIVSLPKVALAHSVETDYQSMSDRLEIQSMFSSGEAFEGAPVVVYAPNDPTTPWLETTTDENGEFVLQPDPSIPGEWSVEIGEGGHWDNIIVPVSGEGIESENISYLEGHPYHTHNRNRIANRYILAGVVGVTLVGGIGGGILRRKLKG
ncbi:MAG: carboxypeptidase regulatory-like domain-containing protein [Roseofilum sp. SBFL]|uniref:carboxypeptidase-like regulatory domain-containing protein n=1 Tax=unclassified Roseofilum TaxID=2620099 RepID=UPI001B2C11B5|nr:MULTISPECIES: carboxypeptidase-like regulatory domain-containing protein [unclassified Roseofilum]MBP0012662.1 carboxypeptidase regulatory-like domain-containing protein [Roseofilum sp. SID3]MBP0023166.1 carboxypeptidase regulatory-like domain-containing protein [Roseofilum sp. SID2]MBP0039972.1 carboxypeptidase regulatory-like domain-containing protein [Roseofilum sp. SID1]MBP0042317.1 carboxypeptidase regulatory-like domain-containing protein [Roseofilum sp. SBFL]